MSIKDQEVPTWTWLVYTNADARFAFDVGTEDDAGVFTLNPDAPSNTYVLTILGARWREGVLYDVTYGLAVDSNSQVSVHLTPGVTQQLDPSRRHTYRIDEITPANEKHVILVGDIFVKVSV